jgi:hypothetical protein
VWTFVEMAATMSSGEQSKVPPGEREQAFQGLLTQKIESAAAGFPTHSTACVWLN